jgi:hypothetical protein
MTKPKQKYINDMECLIFLDICSFVTMSREYRRSIIKLKKESTGRFDLYMTLNYLGPGFIEYRR